MQELKSAILSIFHNGLGWLYPVSAALKNPSQEFKNSFCFGCRLIHKKDWKVKLEWDHFSKVQSGKITVWQILVTYCRKCMLIKCFELSVLYEL